MENKGVSSASTISDLQAFCRKNIKKGFRVKGKKYKDYSELEKVSLKVTKTISKKYFNKFANLRKTLADYWNNSLKSLEKSPDEKNKFEQKFKNKVQVLLKEIDNVTVSRDADSNSFLSVYKSQLESWAKLERKSNLLTESFEIIKNLEVEKIDRNNRGRITFLLEAVDNILNFEEITKETYKSNKDRVNTLIKEMITISKVWKKGKISKNKERKTKISIGSHRKFVEIGGKKYSNYESVIDAAKDKLQYLLTQENFKTLQSEINDKIKKSLKMKVLKKFRKIKKRLKEICSIEKQFARLESKKENNKIYFESILDNKNNISNLIQNKDKLVECPLTLSLRILENVLYTQDELDEFSEYVGKPKGFVKVNK